MTALSEQDLVAANVNPATGLATDYLNLFNEAIMLFEMGLDMPDMAEELIDWKRYGYIEHFQESGFERKDVVIAAYHGIPDDARYHFSQSCEQALSQFASSIDILLSSSSGDGQARADLTARLADMKARVVELDSYIHGRISVHVDAQSAVDALF